MEEKWSRGGLVEVLNSNDIGYINIAYTLLLDKGFFVRVENEYTYTNIATGISLMVKEEDAASAVKELESVGIVPNQTDNPEEVNESMQSEIRGNSQKVWKAIFALLIILALLAIYTLFINGV